MKYRYLKTGEAQAAGKFISRPSMWAAITAGTFPKPVTRGVRVLGWMRWQVEACVAGKAWA
jgi:predicted DNA-binding transcriptional regulator AlpA